MSAQTADNFSDSRLMVCEDDVVHSHKHDGVRRIDGQANRLEALHKQRAEAPLNLLQPPMIYSSASNR